jgi:hypothetical protein
MTMVFHIAQGTVSYTALGFAGADEDRMDWIIAALWCAVAVAVSSLDPQASWTTPASAIPNQRMRRIQD